MVALAVPGCYFAGVEPALQRPVVLIENLNRKNVRSSTIFTPLTYPQVVTGLDSLARFRAQTWDSPELEPGGELDWVVDTVPGEFGKIYDYCYLYPDGVVGFLDFQVKKMPWCQDAIEFIVGTLDISTRRRWKADLLREYLRRLRGYGVDAPSFDEAFAYACMDHGTLDLLLG